MENWVVTDEVIKPWPPSEATRRIRATARDKGLFLDRTEHAKDQMENRGLLIRDVIHVLQHGFVYDQGEPSTQAGRFKYAMEGTTPNSSGRIVRVIAIPSGYYRLKIVTVMWKDDTVTRGG